MAWIESHQSLSRHRKTLQAKTLLGIGRHKLIGHLHELWWWALDNVGSDGNLEGITAEAIAAGADWPSGSAPRFVAALVEAGFIDSVDGILSLHDWYDYAGKLLSKRAANRERMRDARATHVQSTLSARAGATVPNRTEQNPDSVPPVPLAPTEPPALRRAVEAFTTAQPKDRVSRLVDLGIAYGLPRNGGIAASIVRDYGHGLAVVRAVVAASSEAKGDQWEYAKGVLKNAKARKDSQPGGGTNFTPSRERVLSVEEYERLAKQKSLQANGARDGVPAPPDDARLLHG